MFLNSYLVPIPGVRLNLAGLVRSLPSDDGGIAAVSGIDDFDNIAGAMWTGFFSVSKPFLMNIGDGWSQ
ncbi:hypothetical protein [Paraburkholderia heleia]|uniref:hypothetical protein n=1 Tax=Paraburkholderia heleia TaxID=634127 RepID=UPI0031E368FC